MPRAARLDAPGALHHVMGRGIERRPIFEDDVDRNDFLARLESIVRDASIRVYAWALMTNHFHLLVRTGAQPLARSMQALLAGYATQFNRRHQRVGHLFQNRYKSILCEDEPYIHRNPLPSAVPDLQALRSYPFTGHSALLGIVPRDWQDTAAVLGRFSSSRREAVRRYLEFVQGGENALDSIDLDGGGLRRSRGGWAHVSRLDKGREQSRSDERILGTSAFVQRVLRDLPAAPTRAWDLDRLVGRVCASLGVASESVWAGGRAREVCRAREGIAYLWTRRLGQSNRALACSLGLSESPLSRAARRGQRDADRWDLLLEDPDKQGQ